VFGDTGLSDFADEAVLRSVYGEVPSVTSPRSVISNGNTLGYGVFILVRLIPTSRSASGRAAA
jgi:hypothetical protein